MSDATDGVMLNRYDSARAAGWMKWFHITETSAQPVSDLMVERAKIGPGARVVDVATGLGEPALTAAKAVGPTGHVLATDLSEDMMAFAARRAEENGLTNIEFKVMNANEPDLATDAYDAVLCRWGLMFLERLDVTLGAIHESLKPGGRFVAVVWGHPDGAPTNSLADRVLRETLGLEPPEEGAMSPFALKDHDALMQHARQAGFADVTGEEVEVLVEFRSTQEFSDYRRDRASSIKTQLAALSPEEQDAAWGHVARAAEPFREPDGRIRMRNGAFCMVAVR
ncbi:MAG: methyltransferase domain-containing protein [Pseudomonadota bacterium]